MFDISIRGDISFPLKDDINEDKELLRVVLSSFDTTKEISKLVDEG